MAKIHIKKSHEGKFTEYKKRTGKTTEEALHSKDPHVRQMANFARNAAKWHHGDGGAIIAGDGALLPLPSLVDPSSLMRDNSAPAPTVQHQYMQRKLVADPITGEGKWQEVPVSQEQQRASMAAVATQPAYNYAPSAFPASASSTQPIASVNKSSFYEPGTADYSMDSVRKDEFGDGGKINPFDGFKGYRVRRMYSTPLLNAPNGYKGVPTEALMGYGGMVRRYNTGGTMNDGRDNLTGDNPIDGARQLPGSSPVTYAPPTNAPQAPQVPVIQNADYSQNSPVAATAPTPSITSHKYVGMSTQGLAMAGLTGADALFTEAIYNPKVQAREAQLKRDLSMGVKGPNDFYGHDMGMYGKGGRVDDTDFEAPQGSANALVESQEMIKTPQGETFPVTGSEFHSDRPDGMGGKFMNLPPETQVFSKKKLIDKDTASVLMDKKITRKVSPADLVRKFDTSKEEEILNNKLSDPIAITTANLMKGIKDGKKDQVFNAQEFLTGRMNGPQMGFGGRVMDGGGTTIPYRDDSRSKTPPEEEPDYGPIGPRLDDGSFVSDGTTPVVMGQSPMGPANITPPPPSPGNGWGKFVPKFSHNLGDLPLYAPEALATIHALTDTPIWAQKYQPVYNQAHQLNIQADLNRNLSMAYPGQQRSFGNAGVDSAHRNASLATLIDSSNQLGQTKANYDSNQRVQTDNQNNAIQNDASWKNIQLAKMVSDQMAQRQFNRDRSLENVATSARDTAYNMKHGRALEKNSIDAINAMHSNWQYDKVNGITPYKDGPWFNYPVNSGLADSTSADRETETETSMVNGKKIVRKKYSS